MDEQLHLRIHGDASLPTLIYLPGLHGDWTLVASFRKEVEGRVRFVEITYPRTLTWTLEDYARAIDGALAANGITRGWLLGESFGSQVLWALSAKWGNRPGCDSEGRQVVSLPHFVPDGLILAGGFVRHPSQWAVHLSKRIGGNVSLTWLTRLLFWYAKVARFRHRHAPETLAGIAEFVARRTELDRQAAVHRLELILANDLHAAAAAAAWPVFALTGFWDPVVPWPWTFHWLRRNCPSLRLTRILASADHNVLGTAPAKAARQVIAWMSAPPS